eukprot:3547030-Amphidinium_carterae.1
MARRTPQHGQVILINFCATHHLISGGFSTPWAAKSAVVSSIHHPSDGAGYNGEEALPMSGAAAAGVPWTGASSKVASACWPAGGESGSARCFQRNPLESSHGMGKFKSIKPAPHFGKSYPIGNANQP